MVLNECMTAKSQRDTVQVFSKINLIVTHNYIRFVNPQFKPLVLPTSVDI